MHSWMPCIVPATTTSTHCFLGFAAISAWSTRWKVTRGGPTGRRANRESRSIQASISATRTPPSVQTVLLSLAYNRGPENAALGVLANPIAAESWSEMANLIGQMQQNHETLGIRHRRRTEASLIRTELKFLES